MSKENQTPRAQELMAHLALWAAEARQFEEFEDQEELLNDVYQNFLTSSLADDNQVRNDAMVIFKQLANLYQLLSKYSHEDFLALDQLTIKLLQPCTIETVS
ncbi:hypothetical protein CJ739_60 [Mariniflexile rhizosphaerae]|uniref:hypothetical protein n=1 Tax=unclassified Mariniflexile TaxID=2643887 RepID=UPI000E32F2EE|nr:hypothetical protein [Mariniflexile sp. TRM1-10]AXP79160.1 hypothetical protein CJ739_60 [Mariniflexile sp. TRM1-10]